MAYDQYDTRDPARGERSRWPDDDRYPNRDRTWRGDDRGHANQRGFFERAGDEIASWFGDDDRERRRRGELRDNRQERAASSDYARDDDRGYGRDFDRDRNWDPARSEDWNDNRGAFASGGSSDRDYNRNWRQEYASRDADRSRGDRGWSDRYQPMTGDYGRATRGMSERDRSNEGSQSPYGLDEYRGTSRAGSANWTDRSRNDRADRDHDNRLDPHYRSWRDRQMSDLDRDYDDYRAENQSRFESDFASWRERRQQKRGLLGLVSQHMEVIGSDKKHVGTVDKIAGDRLILTKSDPDSGGVHHSLSCSDIDRVEGDKVILECASDKARERWRDESRSRALFERDDQGEMGPRMLDRSFEGTYR